MKRTYKAVIFDLDGTLLDTLADLAAAANRMLAAKGYPVHPVDAYRHFVGAGAAALVHRALPPAARQAETETECVAAFLEDYRQRWRDRTRLYPGIPALLDALTARGIRLSILSNKPHEITVQCADHFLEQWHFETVLGQRAGVPKKPDPAGALETAQRLGLPPQAFFYLGDTGIDMQTARAAGMLAVGVRWGFRPVDELAAGGARIMIAHPLDLIKHLDNMS